MLTLIYKLQLGNDVKPDFGKFVLEHLEEHGQQMVDSPSSGQYLAKGDQGQLPAYSCLPKMGASPLIWVPRAARTCCEVSETKSSTELIMSLRRTFRSTSAQKPGICPAIAVRTSASLSLSSLTNAGTRSRETTSSSTALAIYSRAALASVLPSRSGSAVYLLEPVGYHVAHSPALVLYQVAQRGKQDAVAGLLFLGNDFGNGNEDFDRQKAHAVLIVLGQVLEEGYHLVHDDGGGHFLDEFRHVGGRLSSYHGGVVVDQLAELLAQLDLNGGRDLVVWGGKEAAS